MRVLNSFRPLAADGLNKAMDNAVSSTFAHEMEEMDISGKKGGYSITKRAPCLDEKTSLHNLRCTYPSYQRRTGALFVLSFTR